MTHKASREESGFNSDLHDSLSILNARNKYLDRFGYKLNDGASYGLDVPILDSLDINEQEMSVVFPFADGKRRDGVGDLLEIGGIRTDRHRLNPVILFDHGKHVQMPIGLAEDPRTKEYTVFLDPSSQTATCKAFFYQCKDCGGDYNHAVFCEQLFDLVCKRYIRAGSIGFTVVNARELQPNYETGTPKGLHLLAINMLEASIVVMPANQDTVRKALSLPKVCGQPLSPMLVKSLSPYAPEKKAMATVSVKPPLTGDLSKTDVPPAKWKPGVGAMKTYTPVQLRETKRVREFVQRMNLNPDGLSNEQLNLVAREYGKQEFVHYTPDKLKEVIARKALTTNWDTATEYPKWAGSPPFRKGDKVRASSSGATGTVVQTGLTTAGWWYKVRWDDDNGRMRHGDMIYARELSQKSMQGSSVKSLDELRLKYRKTKNVRRRVKKSSPGAAVVYMNGKDLKAAADAAKAKGVKFSRIGVKGDLEKVRLSGDDDSIDEVAKQFGRPIKGIKSMAKLTNTKNTRLVNGKTKAIEEEDKDIYDGDYTPGAEATDQVADDQDGNFNLDDSADLDVPQEKYSAQVGRRVHEDLRTLMADYDRMKGPLENEEFSSFMQEVLEHLEERLTTLETLWGKHHGDLPGLDGAMKDLEESEESSDDTEDKEMSGGPDTDAVAADSVPDEEDDTSSEEAAEAMMEKRLKNVNAIRKQIRNKNHTCQCGVRPKVMSKALKKARDIKAGDTVLWEDGSQVKITRVSSGPSGVEFHGKDEEGRDATDGPYPPDKQINVKALAKEEDGHKALTEDEAQDIKEDIDTQSEDTEANPSPEDMGDSKGLKDHEVPHAREATEFLKELGQTQDFGDEHRMKSYHYHKALNFPDDDQEGAKNIAGQDSSFAKIHPHRKMCKDASGFFHKLAFEKSFGDPHRQEAMMHHKNMDEMMQGYMEKADPMAEEVPDEEPVEGIESSGDDIGTVQEKRLNRLDSLMSRLQTLVR